MRFQAGHEVRESSIRLKIVRPDIGPLPAGFKEAEGSRLVRLANNKTYPDRIVRRLPGHVDVVFLLIPADPSPVAPTPSFYIMENKVWNSLLEAYLKDGGLIRDDDRRREGRERKEGSWPAFHITAREAQEFAYWLVPAGALRLSGNLPTAQQWDKASGFYDRENADQEHDDRGPFLTGWAQDEKGQIAIGREKEGPLPVGTATKDISRFGCRDMAGNGMEWLRPDEDVRKLVYLRGRKFSDPGPYVFKDRDQDSYFGHKPSSWIGFRVVIEGL
jgi:hypothetical protein